MSYTLTISGYPGSEGESDDYNWGVHVPVAPQSVYAPVRDNLGTKILRLKH